MVTRREWRQLVQRYKRVLISFPCSYSTLPGMYQDFAVQCTWEGDNTILALQAGRSLVSSWESASRGKPLPPGVSYLASPETLTNKSNSKLDLGDIDKGWACVAANAVKKAAADYARELGKGLSKDEAMERCSQSRFIAAKLHTIGYVSIVWQEAESHSLTWSHIARSSVWSSRLPRPMLLDRRKTCLF